MEWRDEGLLLGVKRHGERSLVAEVMTRTHGRHLGLIRSIARHDRPLYQSGNQVSASWRARLEQHLGYFQLEVTANRTAPLLENRILLSLLGTLVQHLRLLPERDPHPELLTAAETALQIGEQKIEALTRAALLRFEMLLLTDMGFGLDLSQCALTGETEDLVWVSPSTGRAVTAAAGAPWAQKLLPLPPQMPGLLEEAFSAERATALDEETWQQAFALLAHFLGRNLYEARNRTLPPDRGQLLRLTSDTIAV